MAVPEDIELAEAGSSQEPSLPPNNIVQPPKEDVSEWESFKKDVGKGFSNFCGLADDATEDQDKWQHRAESYVTSGLVGIRRRPTGVDSADGRPPKYAFSDIVRTAQKEQEAMIEEDQADGLLKRLLRITPYRSDDRITCRDPGKKTLRPRPFVAPYKKSLFQLFIESCKEKFNPPKKSVKLKPTIHSRSFAPSDLAKFGRYYKEKPKYDAADGDYDMTDGPESDFLLEEGFFGDEEPLLGDEEVDDAELDEPDNRKIHSDFQQPYVERPRGQWVEHGGWNYREPYRTPHGFAREMQDDFFQPMYRIPHTVLKTQGDNSDRFNIMKGKAIEAFDSYFGKCFGIQYDKFYKYNMEEGRLLPDRHNDHRPGFTMWITFLHIVLFIVSVSVYGIAPIGVEVKDVSKEIIQPNLALEKVSYLERENLWIGPRQADLIRLGAKFSPCMRLDRNVEVAIQMDRELEQNSTACCIMNDKSGCVQTTEAKCSPTLARWYKWSPEEPAFRDVERTSGSVCGQDPQYCQTPASISPFNWPDDISRWPVCKEKASVTSSPNNHHITCDLTGRPCCSGIQGECIITTREHCQFIRGYFHEEATLCSQVSCMEEICGMLPFGKQDVPDQFYRLWICLFLTAGLFHLVITVLFNLFVLWPVERMFGWIRVSVIHFSCGIVGTLASGIFLPYHVEAGPSGSQFGILACHLVGVILFMQSPKIAILKIFGLILGLLILGLLPMIDNYAHIFGFIFGFLISFAVLPFARIKTGGTEASVRKQRIAAIVVCSLLAIGVLIGLVILFYVAPIYNCPYCHYFNCIPFTSRFCESMEVKIRKVSGL